MNTETNDCKEIPDKLVFVTSNIVNKLLLIWAKPEVYWPHERKLSALKIYISGMSDCSSSIIWGKIEKKVEKEIGEILNITRLESRKFDLYLDTVVDIVIKEYKDAIIVDTNLPFSLFCRLVDSTKDAKETLMLIYERYGDKSKPVEEIYPTKKSLLRLFEHYYMEQEANDLAKDLAGRSPAEIKERIKNLKACIYERCQKCPINNDLNVNENWCYRLKSCGKTIRPVWVTCDELLAKAKALAEERVKE